MKQTAVQWLYNHLFPKQLDGFSDEEWSKIDLGFEQAKEMEKQQIITAYNKAVPFKYGKEYYEETYNLSQQDKP